MAVTRRQSDSKKSPHNNILVTKISPLLLVLLMVFTTTGCANLSGMSKERGKQIAEASETTRAVFETAYQDAASAEDLLAPVVAFADENEIYYKVVNDNTVILVKKSEDEETGESLSVTMHCSVSADDPAAAAAKTTAVLTALQESSTSSRTTAIITVRDGLFYTGAMALPAEYLDTDYMVSISDSDEPVVLSNSASLDTHRFKHAVSTCKIEDYKTYELSIEGLARSTPKDIDEEQADPVLMLYDILSWCEKTHIDYRLCSFKAGEAPEALPDSATVTVAIDKTDLAKFQNHVAALIEEFEEDYGTDEDAPTFKLRLMTPEETAISPSDTTELLGMIYTLLGNFEYLNKDEIDQTVGRQDISVINVSTKAMTFTMSCRFKDASKEHDDTSMFEDLAKLNNFSVKDREIYPRWAIDKDSMIYMTYDRCQKEARLSSETKSTCDILETGVFAMKKPELTQIAIGMSPDDCAKITKALVLFIETSEQQSL